MIAFVFLAAVFSSSPAVERIDETAVDQIMQRICHRDRCEGVVRLAVTVGADGSVAACSVQNSSGVKNVDTLACEVAKQAVSFQPAHDENGRAIASAISIPLTFRPPREEIEVPLNLPPPSFSAAKKPPVSGAADRSPSLSYDALPGDRFTVANTADRLADGTVTNCRLEGLPSDGSCDVWTDDSDGGPGLFARTHRPGEALRLSMVVDVRPWTGALQPSTPAGTVEQVVLLGGEDNEGCGRLGEGGPAMQSWDEVTACPPVTDATAFFAQLGDPRPRQAIWSLAATPLPLDPDLDEQPRYESGGPTSPDYPSKALREEATGRTEMILSLRANGTVAECAVEESSGHDLLDERACSIALARMRYSPGRRRGEPVAARTRQAVLWAIP